ncbi:MAG TPA: HIT family protein, partial [Candidatus Thermoplasmatota archaeon]|nr:HIT family protein [Candidatus Thermoplasmatota archaeon]
VSTRPIRAPELRPCSPDRYLEGARTSGYVDHPGSPRGEEACPFCTNLDSVFEVGSIRAIYDRFPVNPGHLLLVTRRHVATWWDLSTSEEKDLLEAIRRARNVLGAKWNPDAYNIGHNAGLAAGQTVPHFHVHVIPRYTGDVPDPRGGVRHVIPAKGNYLTSHPERDRT